MSSPFALSLRGRLLAPLLAAFLAMSAGLAWHSLRERDQLKAVAANDLLVHAKLIAAMQHSLTTEADGILDALMARPELGAGAAPRECARELGELLRREAAFIQIGSVAPDGALRCAAVPPTGRISFADRAWFRQALKRPDMVVGDVAQGRILDKPVVVFAKAARDGTGQVTGVYYLALDLAWLERTLGTDRLPDGARLIILDGRGTVVALHPDPAGWIGRSAAGQPLFQRLHAQGGEGILEEDGLHGGGRLFGYTPLLETVSGPMYLLLSLPREAVEAPAHRRLLVNLAIALGGLLAGMALLFWAGHRLLVRPLQALADTAERLGGGDLFARSGLAHGDDEIGRLAETLDQAGTALRDNAERQEATQTALRQALAEAAAREQEFRSLADNVPDNVARFDLDARTLYVNPSLERLLGVSAADLAGRRPSETHPNGRFDALEAAIRQVARTGEGLEFEQCVPDPDGGTQHHLVHMVAERDADGRPVSVLTLGRDLTAQRRHEEALRLAACVFHNTQEGVMITDARSSILSVNQAFADITGYGEAEVLGRKPNVLRSDYHPPEFYRDLWQELSRDGRWQGEIWNRRKDGNVYLQWTTISAVPDADGRPARYVAVFHDITELWRKDERLRHLAFHDPLTGLPNRTLLQERLEHAIGRSRREDRRLSITFIDLDGFKQVNDRLGHDIGDLLLKEIAERIRGRLRRSADTVARLGGDEFVVLMEDLQGPAQCAALAEDILADIARPLDLRGHVIQVGASMGTAFFPEDGANVQELMRRADTAMYAAKLAGKGTYRFFGDGMPPPS